MARQTHIEEVRPELFAAASDLPWLLYREIFTHSNEPIVIISPEGYYLEQNAAHCNLLGYSDEDIMGETPALHMGQEIFANVIHELVEKGEYRGEIVNRTKAGEIRHIELSAFAMQNSVGDPLCYVGIKRDITERKRAEEALRRSQIELADFFENATIGLHWVAADGTVGRVNQAELDLLGYKREEYVGHHIAEFHADPEVIRDILQRLKAGEVLRDYEARMRCKDGSIKHVQISSSAFRIDRQFVHTRCFTRDITTRKLIERRLALQYAVTKILSESTDFFESAKKILRITCSSLECEFGALWKVDTEAQLLRCVDVWHTPAIEIAEFEELTRKFAFPRGLGLPGRIWASGEPTWISNVVEDKNLPRSPTALSAGLHGACGFPIRLGEEVLGVIEFFSREIREPDEQLLRMIAGLGGQIGQSTKRQRAEEERAALLESERSSREDAERANRLKDEFLATLSHELRTPLNAVIGWSRMLRSGKLDAASTEHALEVIGRNAWAQKQIIEDILDVSRVITGKLQLKVGPLDLVTVVEGALDAVRPAMDAKGIKIETIIDAGLRLISGDADRLQQVVWNLLSNAAKFTPAGGKVEVRVNQNGAYAQIQVRDTGPGIDPIFLPHVFERFRQADGSTTRTYGGLGLGLAIVRHLVELHGGTITGENSRENSGAIFTVKLPLPSEELLDETLLDAVSVFKGPEADLPSVENLRILVVDDESDALDLIAMELTQQGANVTCVTAAAEALAVLRETKFDLLISDIGMPEVDGYDLMRQVRKQEAGKQQRIPAVALTAYARVQDRMRAILAGYDTHICKPVEAHELVTVVASLAGHLPKD